MKAKKCDRCGEFFVNYEEFEGYIRLTVASNSPSRYQVKQDLCQECEQSLIEWFEGESDDRKNDNQKDSRNKNEQSGEKKNDNSANDE